MEWQDIVIGGAQWVLFMSLFPSVFSEDKPAFSTSLLTFTTLSAMAVTFVTLEFWNSAVGTAAGATTWGVLAYQVYAKKRPNSTTQ